MKICSKCKIEKPLVDFHIKNASKDGRASTCKCCKAQVDKEYRIKNDSILKEKSKQYREINKDVMIEKRKVKYYSMSEEDKIKRAEKKALYNKQAPEYVKQRKKEYDKQYFSSAAGKLVTLRSIHKRRAQKLSSEDGSITSKSLEALKEAQNFECIYCRMPLDFSKTRNVHLDHVIPLSKGGTHSITNVVWSCATCNLKKGNKLIYI
jgi:5-methylcytosine-specific restriction endonuclease McrA